MGFGKSLRKAIGKKTLNVIDNVFGPKSWKTGAAIGSTILGAKSLGMFGSGNPIGPTLPGGRFFSGGTQGSAFNFSGLLPSVIGAGADIWSAREIAQGQEEANQANVAAAREQMAFQERMSSTAHQREVQDLRNAGLNPVLSANSGASTPVGASPDIQNEAPNYSKGLATALQIRQMQKDFQEADSRIAMNQGYKDLAEAQKQRELASAKVADWEARIKDALFFRENLENEFLRDNPNYLGLKKYGEVLAPYIGSARDVAIGYRSLKGFDGPKKGLDIKKRPLIGPPRR